MSYPSPAAWKRCPGSYNEAEGKTTDPPQDTGFGYHRRVGHEYSIGGHASCLERSCVVPLCAGGYQLNVYTVRSFTAYYLELKALLLSGSRELATTYTRHAST